MGILKDVSLIDAASAIKTFDKFALVFYLPLIAMVIVVKREFFPAGKQ